MEDWHACKAEFNSVHPWTEEEDFNCPFDGEECYGGLDLSSVEDMCSLSFCFPSGVKRRIIQRAYLPEEAMKRRLKKGDKTLEQFRDSGHLIVLPGAVIDYEWIKKDIRLACDRFDVKGIGFDRWNSSQLVNDLMDEGVPMIKFGQGFGSMSAPTKELLRLTLSKNIEYNDPLLTWAISNVVIDKNPAGDIKPDKSKVSEKIDPAVSTIMAIGLTMGLEEEEDKDAAISEHLENYGIRSL
jgi:phage terminase large subunit-like protein